MFRGPGRHRAAEDSYGTLLTRAKVYSADAYDTT